jgi:hypothetical protein
MMPERCSPEETYLGMQTVRTITGKDTTIKGSPRSTGERQGHRMQGQEADTRHQPNPRKNPQPDDEAEPMVPES